MTACMLLFYPIDIFTARNEKGLSFKRKINSYPLRRKAFKKITTLFILSRGQLRLNRNRTRRIEIAFMSITSTKNYKVRMFLLSH